MDYLKLFRSQFIDEINKGKFVNFDKGEFIEIKKLLSRTKSYISRASSNNPLFLNSLFKYNNRPYLGGWTRVGEMVDTEQNFEIQDIIFFSKDSSRHRVEICISKLDDEWYLVSHEKGQIEDFFKCDQMDELLFLLTKLTKRYKTIDSEKDNQKVERTTKTEKIIRKIKSMNWEEFKSFYKKVYN